MKFTLGLLGIVIAALLGIRVALTFEAPPMVSEQQGYRGTGMDEITNPRTAAKLAALNVVPAPQEPVTNSGTKSSAVYENVQVLGDVDSDQFVRLMAAITEWVSPEEGCNYCHNPENMAEDSVYTKVVARKMIQMTRKINSDWGKHVGQTGVTCYTCHRGNPVPKNVFYQTDGGPHAGGMAASSQGQNRAFKQIGTTSMYADALTSYLRDKEEIRIAGQKALPTSTNGAAIQTTEHTYALMMHMSQSLGVNCTFCHNSRNFADWNQSRPQRATSWHGIRMARDINTGYIETLKDVFPANRKGPQGDVAKVACSTCHQGVNKPLLGVSMVKDYPELKGVVP
jgi:photosynthetic reaction center cytochrome c subunit